MRNLDGIFEWRPSLIGSIAIAATACGAPVKTIGFQEVLALLIVGAISGTADTHGVLSVTIEESATATGTGASWTTISGMTFDDIAFDTGTDANLRMGKQYSLLADGTRKTWIRAKASLAGTAATGAKYSVGFLLGKPIDTLYITDAATQPTNNNQFTIGK